MLDLLNPLTVTAGDGVFVPASTPHASTPGCSSSSSRSRPTSRSSSSGTASTIDGPADGHLGLGFDVALDAVRRDAVEARTSTASSGGRTAGRRHVRRTPAAPPGGRRALLPRLGVSTPVATVTVPASFASSWSTAAASSAGREDARPIDRGDAFVVPHAAGALTFDGGVTAIVAQPPDPDAPDPVEARAS